MFHYFVSPTQNSWGEDVYQLTFWSIAVVILLIVCLIAVAVFIKPKDTAKKGIRPLIFSGMAMALALITSEFMPTISLPFGGSVTIFSMLFIVLIGYLFGPRAGISCAVAYGMLQLVIDPRFYTLPQMIVDYPLAFGALGLSGLFCGKKHGLILGYAIGILGRYTFSVLSGILFFAHYAPEGTPALLYSLGYNASYILTEAALTMILLAIPAVNHMFKHLKGIATPNTD